MNQAFQRALATAVSVTLTLIAAELGARVWLASFASDDEILLYGDVSDVEAIANPRYERHHYLPFVPIANYRKGPNRHNALGFRGDEIEQPKPDGIFRIALLGGSTTYSTAINDYRLSYPYLLQRLLREMGWGEVEVVNAGCGRYSSWESLLNLEFRVLDLQPDLVVVYHGVNDVHTRIVRPLEAYRSDNSGSRIPYSRAVERQWDRSVLLRILRTRTGFRVPLSGLLYLRTLENIPTNFALEFRRQLEEGTYPSDVFQAHPVQETLGANDPRFFRRNLESMIGTTRIHGVRITLMTFAATDQLGTHRSFLASEAYRQAFDEQNAIILELCRSNAIACYDFAREMPNDPRLWSDPVHVNEAGARRKASLVAAYLASSGLLPERRNQSSH